ncbi:hypothetical protein G6W61_10205 [Streptomyces sp. KAI-26]|uniref:hypothetical protein n=1 Tax=Streptomyces sp. KAI-26 TaxID=1169747 RepID=UPI0015874291|nr:hypothetical protein [Streptomyces sp. KAI-26]NUV86579.1 hypothetical protein [Streptomyces sp. KAI-26]NUW21226.1 hypothetical protein [Streptomyces roseoviolaceus]
MTATCLAFGHVDLVSDPETWNHSVTARPGAVPADVARALKAAEPLGLEPILDEDPELLPDGSVRMWLHPIDPEIDPFETETLCTSSN